MEPRRNFTLRLSIEEESKMKQSAEGYGLKSSEYLRKLIMYGGQVDINTTRDRRDLINQIASVGNNINQLTRLANTQGYVNADILNRVLVYMDEIIKLMKEVIK